MFYVRSAPPIEPLEGRMLLSASGVSNAMAQQLTADGFAKVSWAGHKSFAARGQWVLDFQGTGSTADASALDALVSGVAANVHVTKVLDAGDGPDALLELQTPAGLSYSQLLGSLKKVPGFVSIEPNVAITSTRTPNDPSFASRQWDLNNTGQTGGTPDADIDAPEAWNNTTGDPAVVVGVIDSGIDYNHADLQANMWHNPFEIPDNGIDDDGNGIVDDVYGANFITGDGDPMDDADHGTHVAGTIAAVGNNGTGVTGVAWNARLMALKFLGSDGTGLLSDAISAINYAISMKQRGVNVRVLNASWGANQFVSSLQTAINNAGNNGILFVAAAGNDGANNDSVPTYPANFTSSNIIAVAATDANDRLAGFSNYGATSVDLGAPGVNIYSTLPGDTYGLLSGTSMATPHVTGVAALAWSVAPNASVQQVKDAILGGADPVPTLAGKTVSGGRLNANNTIARLLPPPPPPPPPAGQVTYLSDINAIAGSNGWGPVERDMSVGGPGLGDGTPITLNGVRYAKGLGMNSYAFLTYNLNGAYSTFSSDVGIDDAMGNSGSVDFRVWADGALLYDSGVMFNWSATQAINVNVAGRQQLTIEVTDAGDNFWWDNADWANARLTAAPAPPPPVTYLSDIAAIGGTNGWGPVERDTSVGGPGLGDGTPITLNGVRYAKGLGMNSYAALTYDLHGAYGTFSADVGIDDAMGNSGSVDFRVWADGVLLYDSGVMFNWSATQAINVNVAGRQQLTIEATDGGDTFWWDNADWANARLTAATSTPVATYLSDMGAVAATNGWGPVERDTSVGGPGLGDGTPITLNGVRYAKGLGTNSYSAITYNLNGAYNTFSSDIGIDDAMGNSGSVEFRVWADGALLYDSGVMFNWSATRGVNVNVAGRRQLTVEVTDGGDIFWWDNADWANARLT